MYALFSLYTRTRAYRGLHACMHAMREEEKEGLREEEKEGLLEIT